MKNINILKRIDIYLEEQDRKSLDNRVRTSHHPSGANKCLRQMYYDWTNTPVTNYRTATDIWRMNLGTWMHKMFAHYLREMGEEVVDEVEMTLTDPTLKYPIHGYLDNIIEIDGELYGIELKTVFGQGGKSIQLSGKPREDDATQTKIYLVANNLAGFFVDYLARDSFYRTEFQIVMSNPEREAFKNMIINKFRTLEHMVEKKIIPDRDYHAIVCDGMLIGSKQHKLIKYKSDWQCMYCVYRDHCYAEEIADFGMHLPEPKPLFDEE